MLRFVDALTELDSRLSVGLNFTNYSERVGDARVAYDRIPFKQLEYRCVHNVGVPAEDALNLYVQAYTIWNHCVGDIYCSNDSITRKLQRKWAEATRKLNHVQNALE